MIEAIPELRMKASNSGYEDMPELRVNASSLWP